MSYILDALKKLEKERKRGMIPGLSEQDSVVHYSQRKVIWPYLFAISLLFGAGVLIAWFVLTPAKDRVSPVSSKTLKPINQNAAENTNSLPVVRPQVQPVPDAGRDSATSEMKKDKAPEIGIKGKSDPNKTPAIPAEHMQINSNEQREGSEPTRTEPKGETPPEPPVREKLYKFSELPPTVRESLRKFFSITAYMYSSIPSERMVRINDHMMREGQEVDPGIRIEEITADGVILSYKKFRFFVSVK